MSIRSRFFDSEAGDRTYTSDAWKEIFQRIVDEGYVAASAVDALKVTEASPASMDVVVKLGVAWIQGRFFEVHTTDETLTLAASDPSNPRIDRIVARLSYTNRAITLAVLTGTPAATPAAPTLTRDANTYEISLAQALVGATVTSVTNANITDERNDAAVCGPAELIGAVTDHGALTGLADDDHAQYQLRSEKNVANGYAGTDAGNQVPAARMGSGTADSSTFLRGDRTWAVPSQKRVEAKVTGGGAASESVTWTTAFATAPAVTTSALRSGSSTNKFIAQVVSTSTTGATVESFNTSNAGVSTPKHVIGTEAT